MGLSTDERVRDSDERRAVRIRRWKRGSASCGGAEGSTGRGCRKAKGVSLASWLDPEWWGRSRTGRNMRAFIIFRPCRKVAPPQQLLPTSLLLSLPSPGRSLVPSLRPLPAVVHSSTRLAPLLERYVAIRYTLSKPESTCNFHEPALHHPANLVDDPESPGSSIRSFLQVLVALLQATAVRF